MPETPETPEPEPDPTEEASGSPWPTGHRFADRARTTHATIHALVKAGHSRRAIQRQLGMTSRTVKRYADAAKPEDLFTGQWQTPSSVLNEYKTYLDDRWKEGCTNAWKLWEEIVPLGYQGNYQRVRAQLRQKRISPRPVTARPPPHRAVAGWILRRPESLSETELLHLKNVRGSPRSTHSPGTSGPSRPCSPSARASDCRTDSMPSDGTTSPASTPSPQASTTTAKPSSPVSPSPESQVASKGMSTGSRCSSAQCSAGLASNS